MRVYETSDSMLPRFSQIHNSKRGGACPAWDGLDFKNTLGAGIGRRERALDGNGSIAYVYMPPEC